MNPPHPGTTEKAEWWVASMGRWEAILGAFLGTVGSRKAATTGEGNYKPHAHCDL